MPGGALLISALLRLESLTSHSLSPSCLRSFPGQHSRHCLLGILGSLEQGTWLSPWQTAKSSLEPMCHPPSHPLWPLSAAGKTPLVDWPLVSGGPRGPSVHSVQCRRPAPHPAPQQHCSRHRHPPAVRWLLSSRVTSCSDCSHLLHNPGRGVPLGHLAPGPVLFCFLGVLSVAFFLSYLPPPFSWPPALLTPSPIITASSFLSMVTVCGHPNHFLPEW